MSPNSDSVFKTSATLLASLRIGPDEQDWDTFFRQYESLILGYVVARTSNFQLAQDTLQESMMIFMRVLPRFEYNREIGKFRGYLFRVVHRAMLRQIRREQKLQVLLSLDDLEDQSPVLEDLSRPDASTTIASQDLHLWQRTCLRDILQRQAAKDHRIDPANVELFLDHVIEGVDAQSLSQRYTKDINRVYGIIHEWKERAGLLVQEELAHTPELETEL